MVEFELLEQLEGLELGPALIDVEEQLIESLIGFFVAVDLEMESLWAS